MAQPPSFDYLDYLGNIQPSVPSDENGIPVSFPETLERPQLPPVALERIAEFEPELADVPVEYARDALAYMGLRVMGVAAKCKLRPPHLVAGQNEVNLIVTDVGLSCLPTHALVIHPPVDPFAPLPTGEPTWMNLPHSRDISIVPIHAAILAANCGRLPDRWPQSRPQPPPSKILFEGGEIANGYRVPLVPFCLPYPKAFQPLAQYMYNHHKDELLNSLVRMRVPLGVNASNYPPIYAESPAMRKSIPRKARLYHVAYQCVVQVGANLPLIHEQMQLVEGFWKNLVALAVSDDGLWEVLQLAWEALVLAMTWARGIRAQIARDHALRVLEAANEGRQVMEEDRSGRDMRFVADYMRAQMKEGSRY
ncbi:hypothetical protein FOMPIDRAFT_1048252 [Fomitopsis schrenkii]|uniref:Uncharacterized protein n=1 Tax=Fomitopsis schrenkii TaxID=2126942 RepID=S8FUP8_FOMSC|nr:hypothetical protein FOMPIDRAFT_1048252 [Fomitopsis schrenkii]